MMHDVTLAQIALFLCAAVVAAPLAKLLRIGTVLGYLLVGVLIGPFGLGFVYTVYEVNSVLHFAEFGVVLLLFLIGLELRPKRLWTLRTNIFGVGGAQVALTGLALAGIGMAFGLAWQAALFAGLALSPCPRRPLRCRCWKRRTSWRCATAASPSRCCCSRTWSPSR